MSAWIEKRGEAWTVRWKFNGRSGRRKVPDKKTARVLVREIETCHSLGRHWYPESRSANPDIIEIMTTRIERAKATKAKSTVKGYKCCFAQFVDFLRLRKPRGKLGVHFFSEAQLLEFHNWLLAERGNSSRTAATRFRQMKTLWYWASTSAEYAEEVPRFINVEVPLFQPPPRRLSPTWAQLDTILSRMMNARPTKRKVASYRAAFVMRMTGLRATQACALNWEDISLDDGTLYIRGDIGKSSLERRGRLIPISPHLVSEAATWGRREGRLVGCNLKYPTLHSAIYRHIERTADESLKELLAGQSLHCFRRAFTSELVGRGAKRFAVEILLGRSTGVGGDIYTDPRFVWDTLEDTVAMVTPYGAASDSSLDKRRLKIGP